MRKNRKNSDSVGITMCSIKTAGLGTFLPANGQKFKNSGPQSKFTGSYKQRSVSRISHPRKRLFLVHKRIFPAVLTKEAVSKLCQKTFFGFFTTNYSFEPLFQKAYCTRALVHRIMTPVKWY